MGMSNYVLDLMDKVEEDAKQRAMKYIAALRDEATPHKDDMPDWVDENWHDFIDDKHKQLFGGEYR